jgi:glutamate dehydrogenase
VAERDADVAAVVRAFRVAVEVTGADPLWEAVEQLDGVDRASVIELLGGIDALVEAVARWYLVWAPGADLDASIAAGREGFQRLEAVFGELGTEERRRARDDLTARLEGEGVPVAVARAHALRAELAHAPDVIAVAAVTDRAIEDVARLFFVLGTELRLDWMERELGRVRSMTRMQRWAAQALREDASEARRALAIQALTEAPGAEPVVAVERFLHEHASAARRLDSLMRALSREGEPDLAGVTLAVRHLRALVG